MCLPAVPDTYDDIAVGNTGDVVDDVAAMLEQKQKLLGDMLYKVIQSYVIKYNFDLPFRNDFCN